jgi:hypothetical protein
MVAYAYNSALKRLRQEDCEFRQPGLLSETPYQTAEIIVIIKMYLKANERV